MSPVAFYIDNQLASENPERPDDRSPMPRNFVVVWSILPCWTGTAAGRWVPPKYSWLGADEIPTELPSGTLDIGARSYVPQLGRFLQPDTQPGGSANAYTYTFGDPVNSSDPSGESTEHAPSAWAIEDAIQTTNEAVAQRAAEEAAARAAAEAAARAAEEAAAAAAGSQYAEWGEEYEVEWYEEEGENEYASYRHGATQAEQNITFGPGIETQEERGRGEKLGTNVIRICTGELEAARCLAHGTPASLVKRGIGSRGTSKN